VSTLAAIVGRFSVVTGAPHRRFAERTRRRILSRSIARTRMGENSGYSRPASRGWAARSEGGIADVVPPTLRTTRGEAAARRDGAGRVEATFAPCTDSSIVPLAYTMPGERPLS
jgi:hypothetical protein